MINKTEAFVATPVEKAEEGQPAEVLEVDARNVTISKGEAQPPAYRDVPCAILFLVQLIGVVGTAVALGPAAVKGEQEEDENSHNQDDNDESNIDMNSVFILVTFAFVGAVIVKTSFFFPPATFGLVAVLITIGGGDNFAVFWFFMAAAVPVVEACCYFFCCKFMPFAASNLHAALTAIRVNAGLHMVASAFLLVTHGHVALWLLATAGVFYKLDRKDKFLAVIWVWTMTNCFQREACAISRPISLSSWS